MADGKPGQTQRDRAWVTVTSQNELLDGFQHRAKVARKKSSLAQGLESPQEGLEAAVLILLGKRGHDGFRAVTRD